MNPKSGESCQWVDREPIYSKKLGGITICPSEYTNERGAHIMDSVTPCRLVADPGEKFCPRHKLMDAMRKEAHIMFSPGIWASGE